MKALSLLDSSLRIELKLKLLPPELPQSRREFKRSLVQTLNEREIQEAQKFGNVVCYFTSRNAY
jgi:hypothetical protein